MNAPLYCGLGFLPLSSNENEEMLNELQDEYVFKKLLFFFGLPRKGSQMKSCVGLSRVVRPYPGVLGPYHTVPNLSLIPDNPFLTAVTQYRGHQ